MYQPLKPKPLWAAHQRLAPDAASRLCIGARFAFVGCSELTCSLHSRAAADTRAVRHSKGKVTSRRGYVHRSREAEGASCSIVL
jgi:hypothetical protein